MRRLIWVLLLMAALAPGATHAASAGVSASSVAPPARGPAIVAPQQVDDHDDTRVGVQLIVAGVAAIAVVGVGTIAFFIRWKLGRTGYDRDAAEKALAHH